MNALLPRLLSDDFLPRTELSAARMDGDLVDVDGGWACIDEPIDASLRAAGAALIVGESSPVVAADLTAAWIHGALDVAPAPATFCSRRIDGVRSLRLPGADVTERTIPEDEILTIAGVRVTTVIRTTVDLLCRFEPAGDERLAGLASSAIGQLIRRSELTTETLARAIDVVRGHGARARGYTVLSAIAMKDEHTRTRRHLTDAVA